MPWILDLFCGAGGGAMGYRRAGFEVLGVDINPQPNYPFEFIQADALEFMDRLVSGGTWDWKGLRLFRAIHASPPCQLHSHGTVAIDKSRYPNLIPPTRELLKASGLPYVIENVERAPLLDPVTLCGGCFDLKAWDDAGELFLRRHRLFESNFDLWAASCHCRSWQKLGLKLAGCYGGARRTRYEAQHIRHGGYVPPRPILDDLMGIDWMTEAELFQAVPPAYTEFIGQQLLQHLNAPAIGAVA